MIRNVSIIILATELEWAIIRYYTCMLFLGAALINKTTLII